ncbi:MAG: acyl-CoA thioesterase-like protein [Deltaproteobacteria bacterium]|nr:acyl-CoA thioesterase-like protein [Deltaproteobacteria bacterium]
MFADLAADTAVRADPEVPGRFHLRLPDHWDYLLPSGGTVMTCALRAAEAALGDPLLRLASATTMFCTPVNPGPLVADVVVLRRGGSTAQLRVALRHGTHSPTRRLSKTTARTTRTRGSGSTASSSVGSPRATGSGPRASKPDRRDTLGGCATECRNVMRKAGSIGSRCHR